MNVSMDEEYDSDKEADQRQATIFEKNDIISPDDDFKNLRNNSNVHIRTKSLPQSVLLAPPTERVMYGRGREEGVDGPRSINLESSLDRGPSTLRKLESARSLDLTVSVERDGRGVSANTCTIPYQTCDGQPVHTILDF